MAKEWEQGGAAMKGEGELVKGGWGDGSGRTVASLGKAIFWQSSGSQKCCYPIWISAWWWWLWEYPRKSILFEGDVIICDGYKAIVDCKEVNLLQHQIFSLRNNCLYLNWEQHDIALKRTGTDASKWGWGKIQIANTVLVVTAIQNVVCGNGISDSVNIWEFQ